MSGDLGLTPIPQPSEIVGFLIRNFSHVDDANEDALKKVLQTMRDGKPLNVDAAMDLFEKHLAPIVRASAGKWNLLWYLRGALAEYEELCRDLDCGALTAEDVRGIFDRVAGDLFADYFRLAFEGCGVDPEAVIGNPEEGQRLLWQARMKRRTQGAVAREVEKACGRSVHEGTWEDNLRRWKNGKSMQPRIILELIEHWDVDFGIALLSARAYREYCKLSLVDVAMHRKENRLSFDRIQAEIETLMSGERGRARRLTPQVNQDVNHLMRLVDPLREKFPGEAESARACLARIEEALAGEPRLAGLGVLRGRYEMQMGRREEALEAFEMAANWFAFRSAEQMKVALHHLLFLAAALGDKRCVNRWRCWAEGVGLTVDIPDPHGSLARDFPYPYPEAAEAGEMRPREDFIILEDWKYRSVDTRNPNRMIKGYGPTPTPQLGLFASLGQVEKVKKLLDAGANPNKLDANGGSALLMAIQRRNDACIDLLIQVSEAATINTRTRKGKSPLHEAILARRPDWVKGLLDRGADVELRGTLGSTPLYQAVALFAPVERLLGALLNPETIAGILPSIPVALRPTASPFLQDQAQALLNNGQPDIDAAIRLVNETHARSGNDLDARRIVSHLLDAGANVNARPEKVDRDFAHANLTPFLYAVEIGNRWLLKELVGHGADVLSRDDRNATALDRLCQFGHAHLAEEVLDWLRPEDRERQR